MCVRITDQGECVCKIKVARPPVSCLASCSAQTEYGLGAGVEPGSLHPCQPSPLILRGGARGILRNTDAKPLCALPLPPVHLDTVHLSIASGAPYVVFPHLYEGMVSPQSAHRAAVRTP